MENRTSFEDVTELFPPLYYPTSALVFYETNATYNAKSYTEFVRLAPNGEPLSAQPLSITQAQELAKILTCKHEKQASFYQPKGLLPYGVLSMNPAENGCVIWYTKAQRRKLWFDKSLQIESVSVGIPPLVWKASQEKLFVYALAENRKPQLQTPLHFAPFFNIYENGNVCMGSVKIDLKKCTCLEDFIRLWEDYFFKSYFSHPLGNYPIIKGNTNLTTFWQTFSKNKQPFPLHLLQSNGKQLNDIL